MTPKEINRKIAEACGICLHEETEYYCVEDGNSVDSGFTCKRCKRDTYGLKRPDYFNCLNACAEMEATLDNEPVDVQSLYYDYLSLAAGWKSKTLEDAKWESTWNTHRATAPQRCEAFLRTKGLWE